MTKVFFSVGMSLDGYIAPEGMGLEHGDAPSYKDWMRLWSKLQQWVFRQQFFRANLKLAGQGEPGRDNRMLEETFNRTGVSILGKRSGAPVLFGGGVRLFDGVDCARAAFEIDEALHSPLVTHLRYRAKR